jgi:hexosaminidase
MTGARWLLCFSLLLAVPGTAQEGLRATWTHLGALDPSAGEESGSKLQLKLENSGKTPLPSAGWSLFLSSAHVLHAAEGSSMVIDHLGGDFHRLRPGTAFRGLAPGSSAILGFWTRSTVASRSAIPAGAYLVEDRDPARWHAVKTEAVSPFAPPGTGQPSTERTFAEQRFAQNEGIADMPLRDLPPVFPTPSTLIPGTGVCRFPGLPRITAPDGLASERQLLRSYLGPCFKDKAPSRTPGIRLELGEVEGLAGPEAYLLSIDPREGIRIRGRSAAGVFYGIQTLRGLLPILPDRGGLSLKALTVKDAPRFGYRGLHLDVARNFQPKASVLLVLELMARYKLNAFHFHLTDDEGWRLEIHGLPELTRVGGRRGHTLSMEHWLPPAYGSGPHPDRPYGSGFYTREDYKQILRRAARLHIEVIPELEMPGHARAAIKAMEARYRNLLRQGNRAAAAACRLVDPEDTSVYTSAQTYHDNVMNPALPSTFVFIDKVVVEVSRLHREAGAPLKHLHMGGDEVPEGVWERSPQVQALLKARGCSSVNELWPLFYGRVAGILRSHDLQLSGWEEVTLRKISSGDAVVQTVNASCAGLGWRTYVWNNVPGWGNEDLAYRLANAGYDVVLCPVTNLYFDLAATPEPEERGLRWGGFVDLDKPYDFIPMDYYRSTRQDHLGRPLDPKVFEGKVRLAPEGRTHILGLQGCLWSETLNEAGSLEHMLVPKLLGLAERAWAPDPAWATEADPDKAEALHRADWSRFLNRVGKRELPRLALQHPAVQFRIPAPGLAIRGDRVRCNLPFPGMTLRYTLDGSEPSRLSPVVSGELPVERSLKVAAFDAAGRKGPTVSLEHSGALIRP